MKMRRPIVAALFATAWFVRIALVGFLTVNPATAQAAQLLQDGQVVIITILEGPGGTVIPIAKLKRHSAQRGLSATPQRL